MDLTRQRAGIATIGTLVIDATGNVVPFGWRVVLGGDLATMPETDIPVVDGTLGGWTMAELHSIIHGTPCGISGCVIAERLGGHP